MNARCQGKEERESGRTSACPAPAHRDRAALTDGGGHVRAHRELWLL